MTHSSRKALASSTLTSIPSTSSSPSSPAPNASSKLRLLHRIHTDSDTEAAEEQYVPKSRRRKSRSNSSSENEVSQHPSPITRSSPQPRKRAGSAASSDVSPEPNRLFDAGSAGNSSPPTSPQDPEDDAETSKRRGVHLNEGSKTKRRRQSEKPVEKAKKSKGLSKKELKVAKIETSKLLAGTVHPLVSALPL